jgi:DNA polymerase-3 subunit alpha
MQAAQVLAGYTLGSADLLRRAMGKKKPEEMAKQRDSFVKGCARVNNIPAAKANQIFDLLQKFAGYGFNKAHAAAYAVLAYQTAYLKANFPVQFFCAIMTNDMADTAKLSQYINEARAMGIEVLPPDVNESGLYFTPAPARNAERQPGAAGQPETGTGAGPPSDRLAIRFGLAAIKGVGEAAVEAILKARDQGGKFQSLCDMCERVDDRSVNRKVLEGLIKAGACDCLGQTRATLFGQIDWTVARAASVIADRQRGQSSLFGLLETEAPAAPAASLSLPEWPEHELLAHEKELLGFYVTGHPLTPYTAILAKYSLANTQTLAGLENRSLTRIGGMIAAVQNGLSKKSGKPYSLVTLEDLAGSVQVLCFNENYDKYRELLQLGKAILVVGEVNTGDDKPKLFPQEIMPLEVAPQRYTKQVHLRLHTAHLKPEHLDSVLQLLAAHPGKCPLFLCFVRPAGEVIFVETHERFFVTPSRALQQAADELFGEDTYYAKVDATPPERAPRRWERRPDTNGEK